MNFRAGQSNIEEDLILKRQPWSVDLQLNLCCLQTVRQLGLCLCPVHLRIFHLRFSDDNDNDNDNDNVDNIFAKERQTIPLTFWSYILDFLIVEYIVTEFSIMISTVKIFSPHDICPEKFPTRWEENRQNSQCGQFSMSQCCQLPKSGGTAKDIDIKPIWFLCNTQLMSCNLTT